MEVFDSDCGIWGRRSFRLCMIREFQLLHAVRRKEFLTMFVLMAGVEEVFLKSFFTLENASALNHSYGHSSLSDMALFMTDVAYTNLSVGIWDSYLSVGI